MYKFYALVAILIIIFYSGCAAIEGIFKAGMWWGIFLVVIFIALIIFLINRFGGKK